VAKVPTQAAPISEKVGANSRETTEKMASMVEVDDDVDDVPRLVLGKRTLCNESLAEYMIADKQAAPLHKPALSSDTVINCKTQGRDSSRKGRDNSFPASSNLAMTPIKSRAYSTTPGKVVACAFINEHNVGSNLDCKPRRADGFEAMD